MIEVVASAGTFQLTVSSRILTTGAMYSCLPVDLDCMVASGAVHTRVTWAQVEIMFGGLYLHLG